MTHNDIIYELYQKLKEAMQDKQKIDGLERSEFHCLQSEKSGICQGIRLCIKWIGELP